MTKQIIISHFATECDAALKSFKSERRRSRRWCYITKRNRNFGSIPPFRRVWTLRFQCNKPYYTAFSTLGTFWIGKSIKIIEIRPAYADLDIGWYSGHWTDLATVHLSYITVLQDLWVFRARSPKSMSLAKPVATQQRTLKNVL